MARKKHKATHCRPTQGTMRNILHRKLAAKYHQEISHSDTADQPLKAPRGRYIKHKQPHVSKKTTKVKQPAISSLAR